MDCCTTEKIKVINGTTLKILLNWSYPASPSLTLDDVDFTVECRSKNKVTFNKSDLYRESSSQGVNFYVYLDSSLVGNGNLWIRVRAEVPDSNAPQHRKIEISEADTNVIIYG